MNTDISGFETDTIIMLIPQNPSQIHLLLYSHTLLKWVHFSYCLRFQ